MLMGGEDPNEISESRILSNMIALSNIDYPEAEFWNMSIKPKIENSRRNDITISNDL